jgi:hypothetical protein
MNTHEQDGINETEATNGAIQTLLDFYNNMEESDNHLTEFGTKMVQIEENLENDLRVWWGNDQVDAPVIILDIYGEVCDQPAFVADAGALSMVDKFVVFPDLLMDWAAAKAHCESEGL